MEKTWFHALLELIKFKSTNDPPQYTKLQVTQNIKTKQTKKENKSKKENKVETNVLWKGNYEKSRL